MYWEQETKQARAGNSHGFGAVIKAMPDDSIIILNSSTIPGARGE